MLEKQPIILYVDDDPDDQLMFLETTREIDARVRVACAMNGVEALRFLERVKETVHEHPSLVLMDINMPMMNGKEALVKLKSDPVLRAIPVVMFTTSSHDGDRSFCLEKGAADFVTKPFSNDVLRNTIRNFLKLINI
jgi:CheY-like chemotaxis protein